MKLEMKGECWQRLHLIPAHYPRAHLRSERWGLAGGLYGIEPQPTVIDDRWLRSFFPCSPNLAPSTAIWEELIIEQIRGGNPPPPQCPDGVQCPNKSHTLSFRKRSPKKRAPPLKSQFTLNQFQAVSKRVHTLTACKQPSENVHTPRT